MYPLAVIPDFDRYLAERGLTFQAVIIGSAALALLGVVVRATDDCDVLDPAIPEDIEKAARAFAVEHGLDADWFNCKSRDFVAIPGCLPEGWHARLRPAFAGAALQLQTLGRQDLLCTKLVALVDRGTDYNDCLALKPTTQELQQAWPFIENYEGNPESRDVYWVPAAKRQLARLCAELEIDGVF